MPARPAPSDGNGEPVTPVSFKQLQSVFPTLPGWTRGKPTGEQMTSPVAFSQAEIRYTKGDGRIELKIIDSGFHQLLLAPYTVFLTSRYERQTENGYEKSTKVGDRARLGEVEYRRKQARSTPSSASVFSCRPKATRSRTSKSSTTCSARPIWSSSPP